MHSNDFIEKLLHASHSANRNLFCMIMTANNWELFSQFKFILWVKAFQFLHKSFQKTNEYISNSIWILKSLFPHFLAERKILLCKEGLFY